MPNASPGDTFPSSSSFLKPARAAQASAMPCSIAAFNSGENLLASKVLPAPTPSLAKRAMSAFSDGTVGQNCRTKFRMLKNCGEVFSSAGVSGLMKSIAGAALGAAGRKRGERLYLVAGLDLLHVFDIAGIKELGSIGGERQFGLAAKDLLDALGRVTLPARPSEQEAAASIAGRAGPDVVEVERVVIDELDAEIALLFHRRHGEHERLGTQVRADERVRRVRVGCLDRRVSGRVDTSAVPDLVEWPLIFRVRFIHPIGVLDSVIVHDREPVNVGFLGDRARLRGADVDLRVRCREVEYREHSNPADKASSCNGFHDPEPSVALFGARFSA